MQSEQSAEVGAGRLLPAPGWALKALLWLVPVVLGRFFLSFIAPYSVTICAWAKQAPSQSRTPPPVWPSKNGRLCKQCCGRYSSGFLLVKMVVREPGERGGVDSDGVAHPPRVNGSSKYATIKWGCYIIASPMLGKWIGHLVTRKRNLETLEMRHKMYRAFLSTQPFLKGNNTFLWEISTSFKESSPVSPPSSGWLLKMDLWRV